MTDLRRDQQAEAEKMGKSVLKGIRWLLRKHPGNLDESKNERARLDVALEWNELLATAYYLIDRNVITEYHSRVGIIFFDRGSGETNEGGVRQSVTHVASQAVDQVVLAAVGFIRDHDNVSPIR